VDSLLPTAEDSDPFEVGQHVFVGQQLANEIGSWEALNVWVPRVPRVGDEVVVQAIEGGLIRFAYPDGLSIVGAWSSDYFTVER